jgi:hypothetical protein
MDMAFLEMNQPKTPQFIACVQYEAGILKRLCDSVNQMIEKSGYPSFLVKPSLHTVVILLHISSC